MPSTLAPLTKRTQKGLRYRAPPGFPQLLSPGLGPAGRPHPFSVPLRPSTSPVSGFFSLNVPGEGVVGPKGPWGWTGLW